MSSWSTIRSSSSRNSAKSRQGLGLPNRKNPNLTVKQVFLPGAELALTGELLLWTKEQRIADNEPLLFSRKAGADGVAACPSARTGVAHREGSFRASGGVVLALCASKHA